MDVPGVGRVYLTGGWARAIVGADFTLLSKVLYPSKWRQAQSASVGMMVSSTQASVCFRKADFECIIFPSVTMSDDP